MIELNYPSLSLFYSDYSGRTGKFIVPLGITKKFLRGSWFIHFYFYFITYIFIKFMTKL